MPNATTNNSQTKICNPTDQSVNPPISKKWEIALPTPLRIDAPGQQDSWPTGFPVAYALIQLHNLQPEMRDHY